MPGEIGAVLSGLRLTQVFGGCSNGCWARARLAAPATTTAGITKRGIMVLLRGGAASGEALFDAAQDGDDQHLQTAGRHGGDRLLIDPQAVTQRGREVPGLPAAGVRGDDQGVLRESPPQGLLE